VAIKDASRQIRREDMGVGWDGTGDGVLKNKMDE